MIDSKKMIKNKERIKKKFSKEILIKTFENFELTTSIYEIEDKFPKLSAIIEYTRDGNEGFESLVYDLENLVSFKIFLEKEIKKITKNSTFDKEYVEKFVYEKLYPYYKGKFRINMSRELSFLPLDLRLYVYLELIKLEEDIATCTNYINRISITSGKIGTTESKKLAVLASSYNWILNWTEINGISKSHNDDSFINNMAYVNNANMFRNSLFLKEGKTQGEFLEELSFCLSGFSNLNNIVDVKVARIITELICDYFKDYQEINEMVENINRYLETGDHNFVKDIQNGRINRDATNERIVCMDNGLMYDPVDNVFYRFDSKSNLQVQKFNESEIDFRVGEMYFWGNGLKQNYSKALEHMLKSAEKGDKRAICFLGCMYKEGQGVVRDISKAKELFEIAAKKGSLDALFNLGVMYFYGEGVAVDYKEAEKWFKKAAKKGDIQAEKMLSLIKK